jgi:hypothetical protein
MGKHDPPMGDLRHRDRRMIFWTFWTYLWLTVLLVSASEAMWDPARSFRAAEAGAILAIPAAGLMAIGVQRVLSLYRNGLWTRPPRTRIDRIDRDAQLPLVVSSTKTPMARLDRAEAVLDDLLRQLDESGVPADWTHRAKLAAVVAAHELRTVAAKIQSVEQAMVTAPAPERAELRSGVHRLRGQLDNGLAGYGRLIAAAGQTLIASSAVASAAELTDATDHLAGLGEAMSEISNQLGRHDD